MKNVRETSTAESFVITGTEEQVQEANTHTLILRGDAKAIQEARDLLELHEGLHGVDVAKW